MQRLVGSIGSICRGVALVTAVALGACGDCVDLGTVSVSLTATDVSTGAPVPLAGGMLGYTNNIGVPGGNVLTGQPIPESWPPGAPFPICCVAGRVRIQLTIQGYATADTTILIRTTGACDTPVPVDLALGLKRIEARGSGLAADERR